MTVLELLVTVLICAFLVSQFENGNKKRRQEKKKRSHAVRQRDLMSTQRSNANRNENTEKSSSFAQSVQYRKQLSSGQGVLTTEDKSTTYINSRAGSASKDVSDLDMDNAVWVECVGLNQSALVDILTRNPLNIADDESDEEDDVSAEIVWDSDYIALNKSVQFEQDDVSSESEQDDVSAEIIWDSDYINPASLVQS
ncbi:uncharacterized protein LOC134190964 isoform X2 [Corticium candelabrum]|uniref:uncharacterized protein LOC134190964 isoform X2 n=1 Tax=Corticium candelabrum TaxID=121492 RepID=UPI002E252DC2|nr:uncharacterized protein LOC134190964 isoform X2 [Corticium candelabrum]